VVVVVAASLVAWIVGRQKDDPVEVVEDFFAAIVDRDLDAALGYIDPSGGGVPYGEEAAFLHPDAIGDGWRLLDAKLLDGLPASVEVTIGDSASDTTGVVELRDDNAEGVWKMVHPFATVEPPTTAFTYFAANGRRIDWHDLYRNTAPSRIDNRWALLPGRYSFYDGASTMDLAPGAEVSVPAPTVTLTPEALATVQSATEAKLRDCATFAVAQPDNCPFGARAVLVGDNDDAALLAIRDVLWEFVEPPVLTVGGELAANAPLGLTVTVTDPGMIRLSATGDNAAGEVRFTAECAVDARFIRVSLPPDGVPQVLFTRETNGLGTPGQAADTCRYKGEA